MNKSAIKENIKATLKLQPNVVLYSMVSIGSKLASGYIPSWNGDIWQFVISCFKEVRLLGILASVFFILFIYAIIWQKCIKNVPISIMYANKSSYIFWTQLAAILLFREHLSGCNMIGIIIIFTGIMVVNSNG